MERRLAGIEEPGVEADARIGREPGEHRCHAIDLHALIGGDVGGEGEDRRLLSRAVGREQIVDHHQSAPMVRRS